MTFWLITAIITAIATVWLVTPLMRDKAMALKGWVLIVVLPLLALALYSQLGMPAIAG